MIYYGCPKCQAPMASPESQAGQVETCPECGNVAVIPSSGQSVTLSGTSKISIWNSPRAGWFGLVIVMATGIFLIFCFQSSQSSEGNALSQIGIWLVALSIVFFFGAIPGEIARSRRCPSARGIAILGFIGIFTGILWLVALAAALLQNPSPVSKARQTE